MSSLLPALAQIGVLALALVLTVPWVGRHLAHVYTSPGHWRAERLAYRALGDGEQTS